MLSDGLLNLLIALARRLIGKLELLLMAYRCDGIISNSVMP